jgi:hypothetical protein
MAASRLRDPLILIKTKHLTLRLICRRDLIKEDIGKELKKTDLNSFLRTTLNTELVISILKGITILAAQSSDNIDNFHDSDMLRVRQKVTIEIEKFKIKDAENFNIQKRTETEENMEPGQSFKASLRLEESGDLPLTVLDEDSPEEEKHFDLNRTARSLSNTSGITGRGTELSDQLRSYSAVERQSEFQEP